MTRTAKDHDVEIGGHTGNRNSTLRCDTTHPMVLDLLHQLARPTSTLLRGDGSAESRTTEPRWNVVHIALFTGFAIASIARMIAVADQGLVGVDAHVYRDAAIAALSGRDAWATPPTGFAFAGPPSSLIAWIPATLLPQALATALYGALFFAVALATIRRLDLPIWWLLFTPLWDSLLVVNLDVVVLGMLILRTPLAGLAVPLKPYAALPLFFQTRWRALGLGFVVALIPAPLWVDFVRRGPEIAATLSAQAVGGGLSAWGTWLMLPTAVGLLALRGRGASWLVVPALWPATQLHYSVFALPVARQRPMLAFLLCFGVPGLPAVAVIAEAILESARAMAAQRR
jgi:hypothetical protein